MKYYSLLSIIIILSSHAAWAQNSPPQNDIMSDIFAEQGVELDDQYDEAVDEVFDELSEEEAFTPQPDAGLDNGIEDMGAGTMPPQDGLQPPTLADPNPQDNPALQDQVVQPVAAQTPSIDPNLYFDAEALIPRSAQSTTPSVQGNTRRVDPATQPGSRYIIVEQDHAKNSTQSQIVAANRASALGRHEAALDIYEKLLDKNPKQPGILLGYASTLQKLGQDDEAVRAYERVLDIQPDNIDAHINLLGLISSRYPAVALQRLDDLQREHPDNISIIGQMAFVQANSGRYEEALRSYGKIAAMQPDIAKHLFNLAVVADRAGMKSEAIKYYEKALDVDTIYGGGRSVPRDTIFDRLANLR